MRILGKNKYDNEPEISSNGYDLASVIISDRSPRATDDSRKKFYPGCLWLHREKHELYILSDESERAAVWNNMTTSETKNISLNETSWLADDKYTYTIEFPFIDKNDVFQVTPNTRLYKDLDKQNIDWKGYAYAINNTTVKVVCKVGSDFQLTNEKYGVVLKCLK